MSKSVPGVNVITWQRHDQEAPTTGALVLVQLRGNSLVDAGIYIGLNERPHYKNDRGELLALAHPDDIWAYLPTPPEGSEHG